MTNRLTTPAVSAATALTLLLAGCSNGATAPVASETSASSTSTAERTFESLGEAFYEPPDPMPEGLPGTLIREEEFEFRDGIRAWRVLYHSRALDGRDIAVSGEVYIPEGDLPPGGRPIVAAGPGTTGLADACRQSKIGAGPPPEVVEPLLDSGYIVAITDYEGLGTPGVHPYGVGESGGRGILDIARAALALSAGQARPDVVTYGHSTGGHTAYFASDIAADYAPELQVLGTVTQAPLISPATLMRAAAGEQRYSGFLMMFIVGLNAAYPDRAPLEAVLTAEGMAQVPVVTDRCSADVTRYFSGRSSAGILTTNPADVPSWLELLEANTLEPGRFDGPMLLTKGSADEYFPKPFTDAFAEQLCAAGTPLVYRVYPGAFHGSVAQAAADDVVKWVRDRVEDRPVQSTC